MLLTDDNPILSGIEKTAILVLCLQGEEGRGQKLLSMLSEDEVQQVVRAIVTLGTVPAAAVEKVIEEFIETMSNGAGVIGSAEEAKRMLAGLLPPDRIDDLLDEMRGPRNTRNIWEGFNALSEQTIADYLREEHSQTIAAIMSKIKPDVAARTIPLFGRERMVDISLRMMKINALPRHVLDAIEETVQADFLPSATRKGGQDVPQRMADIYNKMDASVFEDLSEELSKASPEEFDEIKKRMFTFDDLIRLDRNSLSRLIRNCDAAQLTLALRGVKKPVREAFLETLTQRARENVQAEMEAVPQVPLKEARRAQAEIIDMAMDLALQGQIRLPTSDDEFVS